MTKTPLRLLALWLLIFGIILILTAPAEATPPPVRPNQPRPDLFPCGTLTCDFYNPVTIKGKVQRTASYRLLTMPGCSAGTIPADMVRLEAELQRVNFNLVRNDAAFDFTVRINCGSEQIRICGGVNVFCLNRGFPYNADTEISDVLSYWLPETRLAILCHEICGHAIGSWNEQYATCGASCGFAASPGWVDFMNTGPDSRHGFTAIEIERWERTMYELGDPTAPRGVQGFYGAWYEPDGRMFVYLCGTGDPRATRVAIMAVAPWGAVYWSGVHLPAQDACQSMEIISERGWCFDANVENETSWLTSRNDVRLGCKS